MRAGSLTRSWTVAVVVTHLLIASSLLVLAITATNVGKPTWWLASQGNSVMNLLVILPFLGPALVVVIAIRASQLAPIAGLVATALLATTSVFDISRSPGIALGEAILAACTALTTIATIAGRRRSVVSGL